jgi:predicted ATP-dependent Lon-type protease
MVSDAPLAFIGDVCIERQEEGCVPVEDLTYVSPDPRCDSVFIDRRALVLATLWKCGDLIEEHVVGEVELCAYLKSF